MQGDAQFCCPCTCRIVINQGEGGRCESILAGWTPANRCKSSPGMDRPGGRSERSRGIFCLSALSFITSHCYRWRRVILSSQRRRQKQQREGERGRERLYLPYKRQCQILVKGEPLSQGLFISPLASSPVTLPGYHKFGPVPSKESWQRAHK